MKYFLALAATMIGCVSLYSAYAGSSNLRSDNSVVEKIRSLEEERNQAIIHGDAAALDRMTSDDYTFNTLRGELRTKAEIVRDFRSGAIKYQSREISDLNIRVYGNSAVVTGRAIQKRNGKR